MAKIGLVTPGLPEKNFTQDVLNMMNKQGTTGIGKVFVGPQNVTTPSEKPITATPMANQYVAPTNNLEKYAAVTNTVLKLGKEFVMPGLKNTWNFVTTPIRVIDQGVSSLAFQATHNGQDKVTYYGNDVANIQNEYKAKQAQLSQDLQTGKINKTQYDQQTTDLTNQYTPEFNQAYDKYKQVKLQEYGYRDWQTGQYKQQATIGDIWNIIDGAITTASLGTAGLAKGAAMKAAEEGLVTNGGKFLINSLEKIGLDNAASKLGAIAEKTAATKLAESINGIVKTAIEVNPAFRDYAEKQIAKLGADVTAQKFFTNAVAELVWNAPLRNQNMTMAKDIYSSILNSEFTKTPAGKSWLSSGIGQSVLLGSQLLEGGPLWPIYKLMKAGKELKIAMFGDQAVKFFGELDPAVVKNMTDAEVVAHLTKLSEDKQYGTLLDHFMRGISNTDNAMDAYKYLSQNRELIPLFKAYVASNVNEPWRMQAALAGVLRDMNARYTRNGLQWGAKEAFDQMVSYAKANEIANKITETLIAKGKLEAGMQGIAITFSREDQARVVKEISDVMTNISQQAAAQGDVPRNVILELQKEAAIKYIANAQKSGEYWAMHDGMMMDLANRIKEAKRAFSGRGGKGESVINAIKNINTEVAFKGVPTKLKNEMKALGYVYSSPEKIANPWVTVADAAGTQLESLVLGDVKKGIGSVLGVNKKVNMQVANDLLGADIAAIRGANPQFQRIGNMLTSLGLSPMESGKEAYRLINTNAASQIDNIVINGHGLSEDGVTILNKLYRYMDNPTGGFIRKQIQGSITDMRMMTVGEIAKATGLSNEASKAVQNAIIQAHLDVPLAIRGLGDKVVDFALKNPLQRLYQRLQGTLRYTWNPFFRTQEVVETKALAAGLSNGMTLFNPKGGKEITDIVKKMENFGILEGTKFGEGATNVAMGRVTATLTQFQKNDLARYIDFMAQKLTNGNVDELLTNHTAEVVDAIRPIVQYPTRGILNSNLARAVNLAAFPARYNLKVAGLATKILAQQSPMVQAAVIRGLADFGSWLNTPDGMAWRQDYANEIAMFKWLTPVGNLDWTFRVLTGNYNSWRDMGMIGGLPFGLWTTILTNQGILPEQPPYVDPKTGAIFSRKIPATMTGRMAMAITDMLGSVYTYPGRTLMLPSKSNINKTIAYRLTGQTKGDITTQKYTPADLNAKSQREQQFWYNRANSPQPTTTSDVKQFINNNLQNPQVTTTMSLPTLQKYTKTQIRQSTPATSKKKKAKTPVPFQQIIGK